MENAGTAAPLVYLGRSILASPIHLNRILKALSTLLWALPVAPLVSFTGSLLGCLLAVAPLIGAGGASIGLRDARPG